MNFSSMKHLLLPTHVDNDSVCLNSREREKQKFSCLSTNAARSQGNQQAAMTFERLFRSQKKQREKIFHDKFIRISTAISFNF
jgi:hypothetical protein